LNCLANRIIPEYFDNHWIMPNPGDAGSSLGAILAKTKQKVKFYNAFLGEEIKGKYPVDKALEELLQCGIVGVASGRAEFGPRALGNRSLLADPRGQEMKDKVNGIKQRQEFRPFAPVILESDVQEYFNVTKGFSSPYMQQVVRCKYPTKFPAIVHEDGTSRVQTVTKKSHPGLFALLTKWKEETGCPMLLNTSLNIKGKPIVNNLQDARDFQNKYKVKVVS
jgi:carbamoyltransferase